MARAWRRIAGALLAILAFMLAVPDGFAAEPRVLVLNEANAPPFSNPERTGFFDVVAIEAFRRAGLELRLVTVPAARALQLSNSGASDGELNRLSGVATQYPNLIRVPEKLGDWTFAAFGKDASIPGNSVLARPLFTSMATTRSPDRRTKSTSRPRSRQ